MEVTTANPAAWNFAPAPQPVYNYATCQVLALAEMTGPETITGKPQ